MKAYDRDTFAPRVSSGKTANIRYYYKKVTGRSIGNVRSAPPRVALKAFGGKLGIEDFRKEFDAGLSYELDVTRLIPVVPLQRGASEPAGAARHEAPTSVDFADATYRSDNLRLKRPKPLAHAGRNTLERVLGLNSLTKKK